MRLIMMLGLLGPARPPFGTQWLTLNGQQLTLNGVRMTIRTQ